MRYLSTFSGIEAASVAWEPLGWKAVGFSEIDPFASAVLAHRYPEVRNYGDITKHEEWDIGAGAVDVLVGGSPCQAFSVAGLRKGLEDPRGQLTLVYLQLAARVRPEWIVWENVPGVLSADGGRAFGAFLGGLAELGYGFAWRVLDARHFGVPQRRRRVFLVARRSGDWKSCAKVLLEPAGLPGNPPPRGEAREEIARAAAVGACPGGMWWDGSDCASTLTRKGSEQRMPDKGNFAAVIQNEVGALCAVDRKGANNQYVDQDKLIVLPDAPDEIGCLNLKCGGDNLSNQSARSGHFIPMGFAQHSFATYRANDVTTLRAAGGGLGGGSENLVIHPTAIQGNLIGRDAGGPQGVGVSDSGAMYTLTRGDVHGVAIPIDGRNAMRDPEKRDEMNRQGVGIGNAGDPAHTVTTACVHAVAFSCKDHGADASCIAPTLRAMPHSESHPNGGGQVAVALAYGIDSETNATADSIGALRRGPDGGRCEAVAIPIQDGRGLEKGQNGLGVGESGDPSYTLDTTGGQSIAVDLYNQTIDGDVTATVTSATGGCNTSGPKVMEPHAFYSTGGTHGLEQRPGCCPPLKIGSSLGIPSPPAVAFTIDMQACKGNANIGDGDVSPMLCKPSGTDVHAIATLTSRMQGSSGWAPYNETAHLLACNSTSSMIVRRLLPVECERLQGFPDGWTEIPYRGKPTPDGPRYKALGNSMAVPCMAWIGKRIQMVQDGEL